MSIEFRRMDMTVNIEGVDVTFTARFPKPITDAALLPSLEVVARRAVPFMLTSADSPKSNGRQPKPWWDRETLRLAYEVGYRTAAELAAIYGSTESNILFWLRKHKIALRKRGRRK